MNVNFQIFSRPTFNIDLVVLIEYPLIRNGHANAYLLCEKISA